MEILNMKKICTLLLTTAILLTSGCSSVPTKDIQFGVQSDPKAKFSGYKTYAWLGSAAILNDAYGQWEPAAFDADAEIKFLIDRELRERGMSESSAAPDMIVAYAAGINMDALEVKVNPETEMEELTNVPRGALLILLIDNASGFMIWRGVAVGDIQEGIDIEAAKARLDYVVSGLFKEVPK
jgi:hypothetical protein